MNQLREYVLSGVRHLAGAVAAAVTTYLLSKGIDPEATAEVARGLSSVTVGVGLAAYAATEKFLKPYFRRYFGTSGE